MLIQTLSIRALNRVLLYSNSAYRYPGVSVGTRLFNAGGNPVMDLHAIQGPGEEKYS